MEKPKVIQGDLFEQEREGEANVQPSEEESTKPTPEEIDELYNNDEPYYQGQR